MKKLLLATTVLGGMLALGTVQASAATIDINDSTPGVQSLYFDKDNNLAGASSKNLFERASACGSADIAKNKTPQLAGAVNYANGRWVYYTDHNNYLNGYKWGHSNYTQRKLSHSSSARVGGTLRSASARAEQQSQAVAKAKGSFTPSIDNGSR
ncbi:hypothetical protein [Weissella viridescens]|nr:hypothetical protein [Weissella viridescens]